MGTLSFDQARDCVIDTVKATRQPLSIEDLPLEAVAGRVLAAPVAADRDFPALSRSIRDGFAVRSADTPGRLRVTGEVRAGAVYTGTLSAGEAIEIMTGAPVPEGADAVVMVEHTTRDGSMVSVPAARSGQFVNLRAAEARHGDVLVPAGRRIGFVEVAALASAGAARVRVYRQPVVAIIATGDEVVDVAAVPAPHQVRNSNALSLAAQVARAGGVPRVLPVAPDDEAATRALVERALEADLLLLSGGVSAGKYDVVERVLAALGARFFFDRVLIQPGQPLVFGTVRGRFFFGLPGNPASTMVTFELFARAAIELLAGQPESILLLTRAALREPFRHKPGLTRFLPALLDAGGAEITPVSWHGSSDIPALARANAFLVADAARESWAAGDLIRVLPR